MFLRSVQSSKETKSFNNYNISVECCIHSIMYCRTLKRKNSFGMERSRKAFLGGNI